MNYIVVPGDAISKTDNDNSTHICKIRDILHNYVKRFSGCTDTYVLIGKYELSK